MPATGIAKLDWESKWFAPKFSLANCSVLGEQYHQACRRRFGIGLSHVVFITRERGVVCYQSRQENERFGAAIARRIGRDRNYAGALAREVIRRTRALQLLMRRPVQTFLTPSAWLDFAHQYAEYLPPFVAVNRSANYLSAAAARQALKPLTNARLFSESLHIEADDFLQRVLRTVARRTGRSAQLMSRLWGDELLAYLRHGTLPTSTQLAKRGAGTGLYFAAGKRQHLSRQQAAAFERRVAARFRSAGGKVLRGQTASPGVAQGRVRIVHDPARARGFRAGDILVTSMTRPEFLPLMKKAGAIVTDAGGVLSHAAIVSRELHKPCVIGTQVATRMLKDGDQVVVDATKATVRKL